MLLSRLLVELGLKDNLAPGLDKSKKGVKEWAAGMRKTGTMMSAAITTPVVGAFVKMIGGASDLREATEATAITFGDSSKSIIRDSKQSAYTVGLSQAKYLSAATAIGVFGKSAGLSTDAMADFATSTIKASSDLASFYNVSQDDALEAITAGIRGEYDSLDKLGIILNETAVNQFAWTHGIAENGVELTEQQKILARQGAIMDQYNKGPAKDNFEISDGLAKNMAIFKAQLADTGAELGKVVMPAAIKLAKRLASLLKWVQKLSPAQKKWIVVLAGVAATIGPILIAISAMIPAISALGVAIGILTGPIGLIVLALVGLGIAYKTNLFGFRDAVNATAVAVWNFLKPIIAFGAAMIEAFRSGKGVSDLVTQFPGPLQGAAKGFLLIADAVGDLIARWRSGGFGAMLDLLPAKLNQVKAALGILVKEFFKFGTAIGNAIGDWIRSVDWINVLQTVGELLIKGLKIGGQWTWDNVVWPFLQNIPGWVLDALGALGDWLKPKGRALIRGLADGAEERWKSLKTWIGKIPDRAIDALGDVSATLKDKGISLIAGLWTGLQSNWNNVVGWFKRLKDYAFNSVGNVISKLEQKGKDFITGLWVGALNKFVAVVAWLKDIKNKAFTAVGYVIEKLVEKGEDLIIGLWDGAQSMWEASTGVVGWLLGLGDEAAGYLGDAARAAYNALWQAGFAFFKPVYDGMQWVWDNFIQPLIDKIPGWVPGFGGSSASVASSASARMAQAGVATRSTAGFAVRNTAGLASAAGAGTRVVNIQAGAIQVNGVTDPDLVATHVVNKINRELRLA